ncbi:MAG TPA: T9SS type A sorting domain-containing protein [Saprospiraceae bacterium]|nr:T9SS type A sorting domain-containing protein [Saprospiraceae bacterium]
MKNLLLFCFYLSFITLGHGQWNTLNVPFGYDYYSSFIDQGGNMFIETTESIYYSDNYGQSWINTGAFQLYKDIDGLDKITELENHDLLLNKGNDVFKFNRNTKIWDLFIKGKYTLRNIDHQGHIWYESNDPNIAGINMTKDGGISYQFIKYDDPQAQCSESYIDSFKDSFNILIIQCNGYKMFRFSNNGNVTLLDDSYIGPFLFINQNTGTIFGSKENYALSRSTDMGKTFEPVNTSNGVLEISQPYMQLLSSGKLLLKANWDYYISDDDGLNWTIFNNFPNSNTQSSFDPTSITLLNSSDTVIALTHTCSIQGSYLSKDKGINWDIINNKLRQTNLDKLYEDKNGNLFTYSCIDSTLTISKDNGEIWNSLLIECDNKKYAIKELAENYNNDIFAISDNNIFKSIDNGKSYESLELPQNPILPWYYLITFKITPSGNIYLIYDQGALYSKDNGANWKFINFNIGNQVSSETMKIDINDDIYALDIFTDQLIRYNSVKDETEILDANNTFEFNRFELTKNGYIYFYGSDGTQAALWRSKDKMKTYEKLVNAPTAVQRIFSDDNSNLYIEFTDSIYISKYFGNSFNIFSNRPNSSLAYYVSSSQKLYAFGNPNHVIYNFNNKLDSRAIVSGTVYNDVNKDCSYQPLESGKALVHIIATGTNTAETYSFNSGTYNLRLRDGTYNILAEAPNPLWINCSASNIIIDKNKQDTTFLDLGLQANELCPYLSVQLQAPNMRRCFDNNIYIRYCNEGTALSNNTKLQVTLNDKLIYNSSSINPSIINGQELSYNLGNLESGECGTIVINAKLSCEAKNGDQICLNAALTPVITCQQSLPDLSFNDKCITVTGSFDPNEKTAYINGKVANGNTEKNQDVEYLINFQNTGTDTAFRIVVKDKIPEGFDINTFKPLNSSHPYTIEIDDQRTLSFIFDPIALPDSNINEAASHGFIAFKISPKKDLAYGTKLDNYADIYFDFNAAVKTNTALLTVAQTTSSFYIEDGIKFSYYPNPTRGSLNIHIEGSQDNEFTIRVKDILGKELLKKSWVGTDFLMQRFSLIAGLYFIDIEDSSGKHGFGKFNVE